jgi:hypothetical protein
MMHAVPSEENAPRRAEEITVFLLDGKPVSVGDIVDAAVFRDALKQAWLDLLRKLHREKIAVESHLDTDEEKVQAMADQFRYENDLISAEETEAWFDARGLTMEDFDSYITRRFRDEQMAEHEAPDPVNFAFASSEERELLRVEAMISGQFERVASGLGWRMAASRGVGNDENESADAVALERNRFSERTGIAPAAIGEWLAALGRDAAWFEEQLRMEANYRAHCERVLTPEKRSRMLSSLRLPLTLLEVETVEFDQAAAVNEAYLCVHEDGLSMEELAKMGRYPYTRKEFLVEDLSEYWQRRFLAASEGAALEPLAEDGVFQLCRLLRKQEPRIEDSPVEQRIDRRILEAHFAELSGQCVRWILR